MREQGTEAEIHSVPGHKAVKGNEKTDEAAKESTEKAGTQRCPERFASLVHTRRIISERKLEEAKN